MSNYTTEVRFLCESLAGYTESVGYNEIDAVVQKAIPQIFSFDFPIFDESYRNVLCTKILKHYYTREIGEETYGLWKLRLQTKLNEIMPYYNKLYESELLKFNPLYDTDITTKHLKNNKGDNENDTTNSGTSNGTTNVDESGNNDSTTRNRYSDTPQGGLVGVENDSYLTSAEKNTVDGSYDSNTETTKNDSFNNNGKTKGKYTDTEDFIQTVTGKSGGVTFSKMLNDFRNTFLNIDMQVIDELSVLFFNLY